MSCASAGKASSTVTIAIRQDFIIRVIAYYDGDRRCNGEKSYERALFGDERALFMRIVAFRLVFARALDVLHRMDQVAVGNHGMMGGFFKFSGRRGTWRRYAGVSRHAPGVRRLSDDDPRPFATCV